MTQFLITAALAMAVYVDFLPRWKAPGRNNLECGLYIVFGMAGYAVLMLKSFDIIPGLMKPLLDFMQYTLNLN